MERRNFLAGILSSVPLLGLIKITKSQEIINDNRSLLDLWNDDEFIKSTIENKFISDCIYQDIKYDDITPDYWLTSTNPRKHWSAYDIGVSINKLQENDMEYLTKRIHMSCNETSISLFKKYGCISKIKFGKNTLIRWNNKVYPIIKIYTPFYIIT